MCGVTCEGKADHIKKNLETTSMMAQSRVEGAPDLHIKCTSTASY